MYNFSMSSSKIKYTTCIHCGGIQRFNVYVYVTLLCIMKPKFDKLTLFQKLLTGRYRYFATIGGWGLVRFGGVHTRPFVHTHAYPHLLQYTKFSTAVYTAAVYTAVLNFELIDVDKSESYVPLEVLTKLIKSMDSSTVCLDILNLAFCSKVIR